MPPRTTTSIPVASRIGGFVYAIRNIVAEAKRVEAAGTQVRYLNIGDPITFGFQTPPHLVEAVERALARRAQRLCAFGRHRGCARGRRGRMRTARNAALGRSRRPDVGNIRRHRAGADGARGGWRRGPRPGPDVSALHRGARQDRRARGLLPHGRVKRMAPGSRSHPQPDHASHARARGHRPEQSDRSGVSTRCAARAGRPRRRARHSAPR